MDHFPSPASHNTRLVFYPCSHSSPQYIFASIPKSLTVQSAFQKIPINSPWNPHLSTTQTLWNPPSRPPTPPLWHRAAAPVGSPLTCDKGGHETAGISRSPGGGAGGQCPALEGRVEGSSRRCDRHMARCPGPVHEWGCMSKGAGRLPKRPLWTALVCRLEWGGV